MSILLNILQISDDDNSCESNSTILDETNTNYKIAEFINEYKVSFSFFK